MKHEAKVRELVEAGNAKATAAIAAFTAKNSTAAKQAIREAEDFLQLAKKIVEGEEAVDGLADAAGEILGRANASGSPTT